jgi:hypothetical protein
MRHDGRVGFAATENLGRLILLAKQSIVCNGNLNRRVAGFFEFAGKRSTFWETWGLRIQGVPPASLAVEYRGQSFVVELSFVFRIYSNCMVHIRAARQPKRGCGRKRNDWASGEEVVH